MIIQLSLFVCLLVTTGVIGVQPANWAANLSAAMTQTLEEVSETTRRQMPAWVLEVVPIDVIKNISTNQLNNFDRTVIEERIEFVENAIDEIKGGLPRSIVEQLDIIYSNMDESKNNFGISVKERSASEFATLSSEAVNTLVDPAQIKEVPADSWKAFGPIKFNELKPHVLASIPKTVFSSIGRSFLQQISTEQLIKIKSILTKSGGESNLTKPYPETKPRKSVFERLEEVINKGQKLINLIPGEVLKQIPKKLLLKLPVSLYVAENMSNRLPLRFHWDLVRELEGAFSTLISYFAPADIKYMDWRRITPLFEPALFNGLPKSTVQKIPWDLVWPNISSGTVHRLQANFVKSLNPADLAVISSEKFAALQSESLKEITAEQLAAIPASHIERLTEEQKTLIGGGTLFHAK